MVTSIILDLRTHSTWDPAKLLVESFHWPSSHPQVQLRDVVSTISPDAFVKAGSEVVTPASLDPQRAGIRRRSRRYQGAAYLVGGSIQPGDLVVSMSPNVPVLLINEQLSGAAISASFLALRPVSGVSPLWLWGVLNSESGQAIRRATASGGPTSLLTRADIAAIEFPLPPIQMQEGLESHLAELETTTHLEEEESPETWWRVVDLRGKDWRFETSLRHPDDLGAGEPLNNLCREIVRGKSLLRTAAEEPQAGHLPVTDIAVLGGTSSTRHWVPSDEDKITVAMPGDVLVAAVAERPHARVATEVTAVHQNVYALRLHDPSIGPALARFLNSADGFRLRQILLTPSAAIPSMRAVDLALMRIPPTVLVHPESEIPSVEPLALQLERVLWAC